MARFMKALSGWLHRRRWIVLAAWVLVVVLTLPFATKQSRDLVSGGFEVPGSQSQAVHDELIRSFKESSQLALVLVPAHRASAANRASAARTLLRRSADVPGTALARVERRRALHAAATGRAVVVPVAVTAGQDREPDVASHLRKAVGANGKLRDGLRAYVIGRGALDAAMQDLSKKQLEKAEIIGFPIVLVVLLAIFGSLAAALLPAILGVAAVAITGAAIYFLAQSMSMSVFASNMASMIGIGVAVDYSLFVVVRYREELRTGRTNDEARMRASATSGVAIVFSGLTVIVSLAGLWLIDSAALRSMALGAMIVVAVAVVVSAALLPVLIDVLGSRVAQPGRAIGRVTAVLSHRRRSSARADTFWERWTRLIMRRPLVSAGLATLVLLTLAFPALNLRPGENLLRQLPPGNDTRTGYEQAAAIGGPGAIAPIQVIVAFRPNMTSGPRKRKIIATTRRRMADNAHVARVVRPVWKAGGRRVLLTAIPRGGGDEPETKTLVRRLRTGLGETVPATRATVKVGGPTAYVVDFQDQVFGGLWKIALFACLMSVVLLTLMLRSIVLPLKAAVMNLLSISAAYGVMVVVFQWGWLDGFLGFKSKGFIDIFSLPLVLAIVFGLSMDYEIFLLSRIRERFDATGDAVQAIAQGLSRTARTITSAALIMVAVFAVFIATGIPAVKEVGLGLAVAIAVDATIVRLVLVPSAMQLLGRWNWWLPRPVEQVLANRVPHGAEAR